MAQRVVFDNEAGETIEVFRNTKDKLTIRSSDPRDEYEEDTVIVLEWEDLPAFIAVLQRLNDEWKDDK